MNQPTDEPGPREEVVSINLALQVGSYGLQARLAAPAAPVKPQAVLPALRALVDAVVEATQRELAERGQRASCAAGCAACCRQLVPVSAIEAYHIRDLVAALPAPRRDPVRRRFADIRRRVQDAGLYEALMAPVDLSGEGRQDLAFAYYALKLDCPFLEDETCSIYADRPLICREYMVTSPAARCAAPQDGGIEPVPVPRLSRSVLGLGMADDRPTTWPPLTLALDWAEAHPDDLPLRPGVAWVQDLLGRLATAQTGPASLDSPRPPAPSGGGRADAAASAPPTHRLPGTAGPADSRRTGEPSAATAGTAGDASSSSAEAGANDSVTLILPPGDVTAIDMLPALRTLTDAAVARAIAASVARGKPPTCRAGCADCCRHQAVPISTIEARRIAATVEAMPEPRRTAVRARFADADSRMRAWYESLDRDRVTDRGRASEDEPYGAYFRQGFACPLLEDDRCSIYEERPLVCREYVATTPADHCARLEEPGVQVEIVPRLFADRALGCLLSDETPPQPAQILLAQALRWTREHPEPEPARHGAEAWLERFFARLRQTAT